MVEFVSLYSTVQIKWAGGLPIWPLVTIFRIFSGALVSSRLFESPSFQFDVAFNSMQMPVAPLKKI